MKKNLAVVIDINVLIDELTDKPVPRSYGELAVQVPILASVVSTPHVSLVDSDHVLYLLESKLREVLGYSVEDAKLVADLVQGVSVKTTGMFVDRETGKEYATKVEKSIPSHLLGGRKGQVDFEDLCVLGAAYAAAKIADTTTVIITRDGGLHNVDRSVSALDITILHQHRAENVLAAMRRMSR